MLDNETLATQRRREDSGFFGLINKAEYTYDVGGLSLRPRVKSEYLSERPSLNTVDERREYILSLFLVGEQPLMSRTRLQAGIEHGLTWELETRESDVASGAGTGDFGETIVAVQSTTISDYLGYELITQVGVQYERKAEEIVDGKDEVSTGFTSFVTVYAGLGR